MQDQSTACSSSLDVARKTQSKKRDLTESSFSFSSPANISIGKRSKKEEEDILLSPEDYDLWTSSFAAKLAAGSYLPTCRKLGTITRWLEPTTAAHKKLPWLLKHSQYKNKRPKVTPTDRRTIPLLTLNQAKKHVLERRKDYTLLEDEAKQFQNQFLKLREQGQYRPNWDESTGQLLDHDLSCHQILRWMTGNKKEPTKLVDLTSTPKFSRPESSEDVALDTIRVLRALVDLMKPHKALYDQPLMVCLVKLSPLQDDEKRYKLQIAVYANRLLFEIMTQQLQTVMAAIDDSFSLGKFQALYTPPSVTLATKDFESSFFPKVILPNDGAHAHAHAHADTIDLTQDDDHENQEGSTRCNSKTIEAFSIPGLFKLIENKGTFDPTLWNHLKPKLYLELELLTHQEHGICWMYSMERIGNLNQLIWERRQFEEGDSYYYSPAFGQVRLTLSSDISSNNEMSGTIRGGGGILADEMGLGKTIQVLGLVVATLEDVKEKSLQQKQTDVYGNDFYRHATLIIVPPALLSQWVSEIQKVAPWLVVDVLINGSDVGLKRVQQQHPTEGAMDQDADIVLTTYQALEDNHYSSAKKQKKKQVRRTKHSSCQESEDFPTTKIITLSEITWGRIVLDEMQEIRSWKTRLSKLVNNLKSDCRWMLSGTPLLDDVTDLRGELCFLGLEPFCATNDDGFFDFAVANHWHHKSQYGLSILRKLAELIMLRRSKSMLIRQTELPLLGLKPFTLTFEPIAQDPSERALYCFFEFLMHSTVVSKKEQQLLNADDIENETNRSTQRKLQEQQRHKNAFLRILRELCVSPTLLNGGLGVPSQLDMLNRWMKDYNRHRQGARTMDQDTEQTMSCDEAVRFLSQVEDLARTDSDFVTDVRMGGGAGTSNRNRALESLEERKQNLSEEIIRDNTLCESVSSKRAKANWQKALEGVTTGRLFANQNGKAYASIKPCIRRLWHWRSCVLACDVAKNKLPSMLIRGWRPSESFLEWLFSRQSNFYWAHPFSLLFRDIPGSVSRSEIHDAIISCLRHLHGKPYNTNIDLVELVSGDRTKAWKSVVFLENKIDYDYVLKKAKGIEGIELRSSEGIQWLDNQIVEAKANYEEAVAANRVFPCAQNSQNEMKAKKELKRANLGLRIFAKERSSPGHVFCVKTIGSIRQAAPSSTYALYTNTNAIIDEARAMIASLQPEIERKERELRNMAKRIQDGVTGNDVGSLTTFEALQAMKTGEGPRPFCPICLETLGECQDDNNNGHVALTRCGHLCCKKCMTHWIRQKESNRVHPSCIECRKPVYRNQIVYVDPKKAGDEKEFKERQVRAKTLLQRAAEMLNSNHGQLSPNLWEALYLSMDLPTNVSHAAHNVFTAIPRNFLAHLRHATAMPVHCTRKQPVETGMCHLSSKIRALLSDLPRDELSVVFASSKTTIQHLLAVFERENIGCRGLYTGQTEKDSEMAVSEWKSDENILVLLVQAGAAACGLTLTAASKMFLLEPFLKHEEEKQAYARLHRYGQTKEVFCKVYYSPVSVESRLLEWRHRQSEATSSPEDAVVEEETDENMIFAPLRDVITIDSDDDGGDEELDDNDLKPGSDNIAMKQTQFLLGLT